MAKTPKPPILEEVKFQAEGLSTKDQKSLKLHIEKILEDKAKAAALELDLINGDGKNN